MADVVTVEGPDAASYLQGQITQDVTTLAVGDVTWTFVLEPTGRVVVLARLQRAGADRFQLVVDGGFGDALLARLQRFKLRVKAELSLVTGVADEAAPTDAERVEARWPAMGHEIVPGETIPAETGVTGAAVSFTKGCYTGQELVERMDARQAAPPRRLVRVTAPSSLAPGTPLHLDGKAVGHVTTAVGERALAYVNRSVADDALLDGGITLA
jgi:folate-binding protein YgfZ